MPLYRYTGQSTFINNEYNLKVEPNDTVLTKYIIPLQWNFELLDINQPPTAIIPYSTTITIQDNTNAIIDLSNYNKLIITLINPSSASIYIKGYDLTYNQSILLDNNITSYTINKNNTLYTQAYNTLYLLANGDAQVKLIFDF